MARRRPPQMLAWRLPEAVAALAAGVAVAGSMSIEVPVASCINPLCSEGLYAARIDVGSPPQRIWASIDSATPWLWVLNSPDGKVPGFKRKDSSNDGMLARDSFTYSDGLKVEGALLTEKVQLGSVTVDEGPMLLAMNASMNGERMRRTVGKTVATLGLTLKEEQSTYEKYRRESIFDMFGAERVNEEKGKKLKSFFKEFWEEHPEVPQTFFLSLGTPKPRMVIGADLENGPEARGLTYMADIFTKRSSLWYTSLRAIGFSMAPTDGQTGSGTLVWNLDFNQFSLEGAPARLDSGSKAIHVGHLVFERMLANLNPSGQGRCRANEERSIDCPCNPNAIEATFPWISLSFETLANYRVLGFDVGKDHRVCIPPSSYVTAVQSNDRVGTCRLAIVDAGLYQRFFGLEGIVLGVPFFKSVPVGMDLDRHRLAFGPSFTSGSVASSFATGESMQMEAGQSGGGMASSVPLSKAPCPCADPKNWWNVGHRFSAMRVVVVLVGTALVLFHIYFTYSPSAEGLRTQLEGLTGGATPAPNPDDSAAPLAAPGRGPTPDRPFIEMAGGPYGGPE